MQDAEGIYGMGGTAAAYAESPASGDVTSAVIHAERQFTRGELLHSFFERQVERTPKNVAVVCDGQSLTYEELNSKANQVAHALIGKGVGPEQLVAVCLERSLDLVVSLIGVLKAGAAYVPLDPAYPRERLAYMLEDARPTALITVSRMSEQLSAAHLHTIALDKDLPDPRQHADAHENPDPKERGVRPENLAYVIYTSGSTGNPKGVMVEHRNVVRLFSATQKWFDFDERDVWTLFHSYAFDFSVWELWGPLLYGGRLVVVPYFTSRSPESFYQLLCTENVTVLNQTPSAFSQLIDAQTQSDGRHSLRLVIFGGESLDFRTLRPWVALYGVQRPLLVNMYGITETTVHVTYKPLGQSDIEAESDSLIGEAIPDLTLNLLDSEHRVVPPHDVGEIYVGGAGVARGYLRRPELTAERFIADARSDKPGVRLYKAGDLARRREDGSIEYLGRNDHQVKVRGFRIELGEIEAVIGKHPNVKEVAVLAREDVSGERRLVGYVTTDLQKLKLCHQQDANPKSAEIVSQWMSLYEGTYSTGEYEPSFVGWNSSYTGEAIPIQEMREWRDETIGRIRSLGSRRILEVGCGVGLLLERLAPDCEVYRATDLSHEAIDRLRKWVSTRDDLRAVDLEQAAALDVEAPRHSFDTVILNSVIQYFPDLDYLHQVLRKAAQWVRPGGQIFVGDVRHFGLLLAFHGSVQLERARGELDIGRFRSRVSRAVELEKELLIHPQYFRDLKDSDSGISEARVLLKRGTADNELTRYRYDVILKVGHSSDAEEVTGVRFFESGGSIQAMRSLLRDERPSGLRVLEVPNRRLQRDVRIARVVSSREGPQDIADLKRDLEQIVAPGLDPEEFWRLGEELGYEVSVGWSPGSEEGYFDVEFLDGSRNQGDHGVNHSQPNGVATTPGNWKSYANDPLGSALKRELVITLRTQLKDNLPQHMIPGALIVLDRFPLTENGKLDRRALPAPNLGAYATRNYEAPAGEVEEILATIWQELLRLEQVGRADNFFELGGNSLLMVQMMERLGETGLTVEARSVFESPTLAALAKETRRKLDVGVPPNLIRERDDPITPEMLPLVALTPEHIAKIVRSVPGGTANIQDIYPLTPLQEGMLFHRLLDEGSADAYVLFLHFSLPSRERLDDFIRSLQATVERHDVLRTAVLWEELPRPVQVVYRHSSMPVAMLELDTTRNVLEQIKEKIGSEGNNLDLRRAPLMRLFCAESRESGVCHAVLQTHHIVHDKASLDAMFEEVKARLEGHGADLPPAVPFRNHVARVLSYNQGLDAEAFFSRKLRDVNEPTAPFGLISARGSENEVEEARLELEAPLAARIRSESQRMGVSTATIFHAAWSLVIARLCGRDDVVFGTVLLGRMRGLFGEGRMLGLFINTLPVRITLGKVSVASLVDQTRRELAELLDHELASLSVAQRCCGLDGSVAPFTAILNYLHSASASESALSGSSFAVQPIGFPKTNYPIAMSVSEQGGKFLLIAQTDTRISPRRTIKYLSVALQSLVEALDKSPDVSALELNVLPPTERDQLIRQFNDTATNYPREQPIYRLFEAWAERVPASVAALYEEQSLDYQGLNKQANQVAHFLHRNGVEIGENVPLLLPRSLWQVVVELALLKVGAAYVPIDPEIPPQRQAFMIGDCGARVIISESGVRPDGIHSSVRCLDLEQLIAGSRSCSEENLSLEVPPTQPACVMYTSGSTGTPKGVGVPHFAIVRLVLNHRGVEFQPSDCVSHCSNPAFDAAALEVWGALLNGARLVIVPQIALLNVEQLASLIERRNVTVLFLTVGLFAQYADTLHHVFKQCRYVMTGGDVLDPSVVRRALQRDPPEHLINMYGPTEGTTVTSIYPVRLADTTATNIPIGRPLSDTQMYVLDDRLQPVPLGVASEIYIGGDGVAQGYLNRPDLTAERFIADPYSLVAGGRLYRSGDLGRWREDGNVEFLGRNDHQVKLRGFRIELGEIEANLARHPKVKEALLSARQEISGEKRLVAYVVPGEASNAPDAEELRTHLKVTLPEYMVPSAFVMLEAIPLTANGKADRRRLPAPDRDAYIARRYEAPHGESEKVLARIWADLLRVQRLGRYDNFFELGGHSLLIVRMVEALRAKGLTLEVRRVYDHPTLHELASLLRGIDTVEVGRSSKRIPMGCTHITPEMLPLVDLQAHHIEQVVRSVPGGAANIKDIYPLSPLQEGLLFHHLFDARGGDAYVRRLLWAFESREKLNSFIAALQKVVDRHDSLRTAVLWEQLPRPMQVVYRKAEFPVEEVKLEAGDGAVSQLRDRMKPERQRMNLHQAPLLRLEIAADPHGTQWFALMQSHHIVDDAASLNIVMLEILAHITGHEGELPEPVPYRDHVAQVLTNARPHEAEEFFRTKLGDIDEPTAPFELLDVHGDGSQIEEARQPLDAELAARIRAQARSLNVSAATLFHAAWALVVARTSGRDDVVFGTVLLGRMQGSVSSDRILGMFINTLPLRLRLGALTAVELVQRTQTELVELLNQEQCSLAVAQRCSGVNRAVPLFTALLNYRHGALDLGPALRETAGATLVAAQGGTNYPITFSIDDLGEGFSFEVEADRRVGPWRLIAYMSTALASLVEALETAPQSPAVELSVLPAEESDLILRSFNATQAAYPREKLIHELFEEQVKRTPGAVAASSGLISLTYAELNLKANQMAHRLRREGIGPDRIVGICLERGVEMVVAVLGTLKAGGAYVPLDPNYPAERLAYMLSDASPAVILTQERLRDRLADTSATVIALDGDWSEVAGGGSANLDSGALGLRPNHLAYLIYTSGSTGQPKGVAIEHRNTVNLIFWARDAMNRSVFSRTLHSTSLNFDLSIYEMFVPLSTGGRLDVVENAVALIREPSEVTLINTVPSAISAVIEAGRIPETTIAVNLAGEALKEELVRRIFAQSGVERVSNLYGPSETTTYSTWISMTRKGGFLGTIGRPIANTQVYILSANGQPVPTGVTGEIYIGGAGVARGYLNRPDLSAQRFLRNPFSSEPQSRIYRTGDLGRWRHDGTIEYLGRNDHQIKLRGYRIELGEIESRLTRYGSVKAAVVLAREDAPGEKRLVAYVVPESHGTGEEDATLSVDNLYGYLRSNLPDYMVPAAIVVLAKMPLTSNGKIDRRSLPAPELHDLARKEYEPPGSRAESEVAMIWAAVLRVERIGRRDNFFDLGGHSLLATVVISRIRDELSVDLPVRAIFDSPTVETFSALVEATARSTAQQEAAWLNDISRELKDEIEEMGEDQLQAEIERLKQELQGDAGKGDS